MTVEWLFLAVPWGCLRFVIVVFPDHTHYFSNLSYVMGIFLLSCKEYEIPRKTRRVGVRCGYGSKFIGKKNKNINSYEKV